MGKLKLEKMKFTKKALATIFILLLALDSISSRSFTKRTKSNSKTLGDSLSASNIFMKTLTAKITNPLNISYFLMGIMSEWISGVHEVYLKVKKVEKVLLPCEKLIGDLWKIVEGNPTDAKQLNEQKDLKDKEANLNIKAEKQKKEEDNPTVKKENCEKLKIKLDLIADTYMDNFHKDTSLMYGPYTEEQKKKMKKENDLILCSGPIDFDPTGKVKKQILEDFDSLENFEEVCKDLRGNNDCSKYHPDNNGAWELIKKTAKYAKLLDDGADCVKNVLMGEKKSGVQLTPAEANLVKDLHETAKKVFSAWSMFKTAAKQAGAFILNYMSFGIAGALKAAWNILRLVKNIFTFVKDVAEKVMDDMPYHIGKIVGIVLKIMKNLILGRRRR